MNGRKYVWVLLVLPIFLWLSACRSTKPSSGSGGGSKPSVNQRDEKVKLILQTAKSYTGTPWKLGGESKTGIDCSGLVVQSYGKAGVQMPRRSIDQSKVGKDVKESELRPGDLLFFAFSKVNQEGINHVGIVSRIESDKVYFIHTSRSKGVMESCLCEKYFREGFVKAKNVL
jgi:probable lipoprotein NlpC